MQLNLPSNIKHNIDKIGFAVYEYIDFDELRKSFLIDYFLIVRQYSWMLFILMLIGIILSYILENIVYLIVLVFGSYFFVYIFSFKRFLPKIKYFVNANRIIVTDEWVIFTSEIIKWKDTKLSSKLSIYEKFFKEKLFWPSKIDDSLLKLVDKLVFDLLNKSNFVENLLRKYHVKDQGVFKSAMWLYALSIVIFYLIWYFVAWIVISVVSFFIKAYLKIKWNLEYKIYKHSLDIDRQLKSLQKSVDDIVEDFKKFKAWGMYSLSKTVEKGFKDIYKRFSELYKKLIDLVNLINNSRYKNLIDFSKTKSYLFNQYNKPLDSLLKILQEYIDQVDIELDKLKQLIQSIDLQEYKANLELKVKSLSMLKKSLEENKIRLEKLRM